MNATSAKIARALRHILLPLDGGPTLELMTVPDLPDAPAHPEFIGWAHIAIHVGSQADVDRMAAQAQSNGTLLSAPA